MDSTRFLKRLNIHAIINSGGIPLKIKDISVILALDLGTTGNRAIVFDASWNVVASAYREFEQLFPQPGWVEHRPADILSALRRVIDQVLHQVDGRKISAVGVTNQRETVVLWDAQTGEPVYNAIVWQCRRTAERCRALAEHAPMIKAKTGLPLDPYFSATKMAWILEHVPAAKRLAKLGRLRCGTIDAWVIWELTAGASFVTDPSNVSRTMLYDLSTGAYDPELLNLFGIPPASLPGVLPSDGAFGRVDPKWGFSAPICAVMGDQQSALFAQCGESEGVVKNTYGTGLFVVTPTANPVWADHLVTTVAWERAGTRWYALEGSIFVGGSLIQWLRDQCRWVASAEDSEALAQSVPDSGGVMVVPAFVGLGAPYWCSEARGAIFGLTRGTSPAHIVRASLEALAYQSADVIDVMAQALGVDRFSALRVDGGASHNAFLMQIQADLIGSVVEQPKFLESTALGVAGMAAMTTGVCTDAAFRMSNPVQRSFSPRPLSGDLSLARWRRAVRQVVELAHDNR